MPTNISHAGPFTSSDKDRRMKDGNPNGKNNPNNKSGNHKGDDHCGQGGGGGSWASQVFHTVWDAFRGAFLGSLCLGGTTSILVYVAEKFKDAIREYFCKETADKLGESDPIQSNALKYIFGPVSKWCCRKLGEKLGDKLFPCVWEFFKSCFIVGGALGSCLGGAIGAAKTRGNTSPKAAAGSFGAALGGGFGGAVIGGICFATGLLAAPAVGVTIVAGSVLGALGGACGGAFRGAESSKSRKNGSFVDNVCRCFDDVLLAGLSGALGGALGCAAVAGCCALAGVPIAVGVAVTVRIGAAVGAVGGIMGSLFSWWL